MIEIEGGVKGAPIKPEWPAAELDDDDVDDEQTLPLVQTKGKTHKRQGRKEKPIIDVGMDHHLLLSWMGRHAAFLLMPVVPLLWCLLLVTTMDREMVLSAWAMPLLGIASASLANAVPVGGGIVFVPMLSLFGFELELGASFAVATMTFGNGVFGFLSWLRRDPSSIAWDAVPPAVVPAWIGAAWATVYPFLRPNQCRRLFALFCLAVAAVVARGIYVGRESPGRGKEFSIARLDAGEGGGDDDAALRRRKMLSASACSFLAGSVLVAHIGIGNAMTTFLVCSFVWGLPAKACVVTGILVGGWTSAVPFALHLLVFRDVPVALWVMGLPGVYLGARIAPLVHDRVGMPTVLMVFCLFLVATALLMVSTA